jgi:hypothetical protein
VCFLVLHLDLNTLALATWRRRGKVGHHVQEIVCGMPVQTGAEALLIEEMGDETDAAAENEQPVEHADAHILLCFLGREGAAVAEQINEADGNAAVDVQNQIVFLRGRHLLDGQCVIKELGRREAALDVVFHELHSEIGVVAGLDAMTNTGD